MDFYNVLQQMVTLAPGLRLVYRTNFAGMYNDISQVRVHAFVMSFLAWLIVYVCSGGLLSQPQVRQAAAASPD
jgi:hypothetical protein